MLAANRTGRTLVADKGMTFKLFGKDVSASSALKGVGRSADSAGGHLSHMGAAFAGIGTAAVVAGASVAIDFGKQSIDAFTEAQAQAAKFDYAFAKFPQVTAYKGKIDALSTSLALKTKYDDDATKAAAGTLAQFGLTGKQVEKLLPLTQDFASATGSDLTSASTQLGKAMMGNVKALKAVGISYKPTGDKAKDFTAIQALLSKKVGGFAEKEGKTAAGTAAILANQFGEVKEKVGSYLVPALTKMGTFVITKMIPAIQKMVDWLRIHLLPTVKNVGHWIMTSLWPALQKIAKIMLEVVWPAIQRLAKSFMKDIWPAIQKVAKMVMDNLKPAIDALMSAWAAIYQVIVDNMPLWQQLGKWIGIVVGFIIVLVSWVIGKLYPVLAVVFVAGFKIAVGAIKLFADVIQWVIDNAPKIWETLSGLPDKINQAVSGAWDGLKNGFKSALNAIIGWWNQLSFTVPTITIAGHDFGGGRIDFPNVPYLADGGIVRSRTLAMIGEAGPEAVIPLSRTNGFGSTTIHVHVAGMVVGTQAQLAQQIGTILQRGNKAGIRYGLT